MYCKGEEDLLTLVFLAQDYRQVVNLTQGIKHTHTLQQNVINALLIFSQRKTEIKTLHV